MSLPVVRREVSCGETRVGLILSGMIIEGTRHVFPGMLACCIRIEVIPGEVMPQ